MPRHPHTATHAAAALALTVLTALLLSACAVDPFVPDDALYLRRVNVVSADEHATSPLNLEGYVRQQPNTRWFGAKVPLHIYCLSRPASHSWASRLLRKIGQPPVLHDTLLTTRTVTDMQQVLANAGYVHSQVTPEQHIRGRHLTLTYTVRPAQRYHIASLQRDIADQRLRQTLCGQDTARSLIQPGMPFDINRLNDERTRITTRLRAEGYYKFNKDYITFTADTLPHSTAVHLKLTIGLHLEDSRSLPQPHTAYHIGHINYEGDTAHFRRNLLTSNTRFRPGELYNEDKQRRTYLNFTRLQAISYTNIRLAQRPDSTDTLDATILVGHARPQSIAFDLEGTNSAGDLGAAASTTYQHRNLLHGSETLTLKLRGAYEAITGLEGYDGHNYTEFGGEARLTFPVFLLPYVKREYGAAHNATSEIALQYNLQNRPEFNRRVLTAAWRYRWQNRTQRVQHRLDLLEVNYIYMPWISTRFREQYLDSIGRQNAILRYNYENLLITKIGYYYSYNSLGAAPRANVGQTATTLRWSVETSGNLLSLATKAVNGKRNDQGQRTFCGIAFAQYARADLDIAHSLRIDDNNSVVLHANLGIAAPYGNSPQVPFEKRYFAGGANSVRGWSVRSLGPGGYKGADKQINFLNQSGDIKLDLNLEYRTHLFWQLNGAAFIDAGNIWTIRHYQDQPDGAFTLAHFAEQIALSYGLGLRLALDFFTLRFDAGMKAIDPAASGRDHYPLIHPNLSRDFAFHFAVGLPF